MGLDNPLHIAFVIILLLLVFGARRLPEIGRSLGTGMREFKTTVSGESKQPSLTHTAQPQQPPPPVAAQPAAQAFGTPPEQAAQPQMPAEPTHPA